MGWFGKKQKPPLVPGRDRVPVNAKARPVYSYYAGRDMSDKVGKNKQSRTAFVTGSVARLRFSAYVVVVALCTLVVVACVVKLLAVSNNSKVIISTVENYPTSKPATDTYAKAADSLLRGSLLNRSKLTLDTNGIATSLQKQFPELTSVVVTVPLVGNRPVIYVSPSKPAFTLQTGTGFYSMDAKGYVLAQLAKPADALTLLKEASNRTPKPGSQYLATSTVAFCVTVAYELKQGGVQVSYLDLPTSAPYELDAYVSEKPYRIRFNLQADAMQQSGAAVAAIQHFGASTPGQYLDVRVSERVYYK